MEIQISTEQRRCCLSRALECPFKFIKVVFQFFVLLGLKNTTNLFERQNDVECVNECLDEDMNDYEYIYSIECLA
jgi:hypothetical protein